MTSGRETSSFDLKDDALHTEEAMGVVLHEDPQWKKRERRVLRKLDIFIGPYLAVLMILSHLDRSNIGFATTQGMAVDIGLYGNRLNVDLSARFLFLCANTMLDRLPSPSFTSFTSWSKFQRLCWSKDFDLILQFLEWLSLGV